MFTHESFIDLYTENVALINFVPFMKSTVLGYPVGE